MLRLSGLSILKPDYFFVLMYNLFNLLLNPLLISHQQDLNFRTADILGCLGSCKGNLKAGAFSLQLAGRFTRKSLFLEKAPLQPDI